MPDRLMGWTPIRDGAPLAQPQPTRDNYLRITSHEGTRYLRKEPPTLPAMPQMLPDDPTEAAVSLGAMKAMMTAHGGENEQVRAIAGAVRALTVGAQMMLVATMAWGAGRLLWPERVTLELLPLAWLVALICTVGYTLASEGAGRRYSAAGVERLKIRTAERMHRDRLESREAMHAAATEAWENVLTKYLDTWEG